MLFAVCLQQQYNPTALEVMFVYCLLSGMFGIAGGAGSIFLKGWWKLLAIIAALSATPFLVWAGNSVPSIFEDPKFDSAFYPGLFTSVFCAVVSALIASTVRRKQ